ncbi:TPA: hypothetical protein EYP66_14055 [Candidatus Poribacteria bacterium]|nr:hypothetical protein [Candidatus Poribacteria bacterium]
METEESILSQLKKLVDKTSEQLRWGKLSLRDAIELTEDTKEQAKKLIPDMMDKYDLIYESRFERLIWQFVMPRQNSDPQTLTRPLRVCPKDIR